jgi:hypothetical protein
MTTGQIAKIGIGGIIAGGVGWLNTNFAVTPKTALAQAILFGLAYIVAGLTHGSAPDAPPPVQDPPAPSAKRFGAYPREGVPGPHPAARVALLCTVLLAVMGVTGAAAQAKPKARAATVADTAERYHVELGVDAVMRSDSVTEPQSARIGYLIGNRFTVEYRGGIGREASGAFRATAELGVTAALLDSTSNRTGLYVEPLVAYHTEGGPAQVGVGLESGSRTVKVGTNITVRASMFTVDYFKTKRLPTVTSFGARIGISFWQ